MVTRALMIATLVVPLAVAGASGSAAAKGKRKTAAAAKIDLSLVELPADFTAAGWTRGTPRLDKKQHVLDGRKVAVWEEDDQLGSEVGRWLGVTDTSLTRAILLFQLTDTLGDGTVFYRYTPAWTDVDGDGEDEVVLTLAECYAPCTQPQEVVYQRRFGAMRVVSRDAAKCPRNDADVDWVVAGAEAPADVTKAAWTRAIALLRRPAGLYCAVWDLAFLRNDVGPAVGTAFETAKVDDVEVIYYLAANGRFVRLVWTGVKVYPVEWSPKLGLLDAESHYLGYAAGVGVAGPLALLTVDIETTGAVARWAVLMKLDEREIVLSVRLDGPKARTARLVDEDSDSLSELVLTDSTGAETTYWYDQKRGKWVW